MDQNEQNILAMLTALTGEAPESLAAASHSALLQLREGNKGNKDLQKTVAPFEHRAWAREFTQQDPMRGWIVPVLSAGYAAKKKISPQEGETPADIEQVLQAFIGTLEGYRGK